MKKTAILIILVLAMVPVMQSCFHFHDRDISITVSDDEDEYEMDADYSRSKSHAVQVYLNNHLLNGQMKIRHNDYVSREIVLDDNTNFYIDAHPGRLNIRIDKTENSEEQCERIKEACEDLKEILARN